MLGTMMIACQTVSAVAIMLPHWGDTLNIVDRAYSAAKSTFDAGICINP
jgi:hypothetical protein